MRAAVATVASAVLVSGFVRSGGLARSVNAVQRSRGATDPGGREGLAADVRGRPLGETMPT